MRPPKGPHALIWAVAWSGVAGGCGVVAVSAGKGEVESTSVEKETMQDSAINDPTPFSHVSTVESCVMPMKECYIAQI